MEERHRRSPSSWGLGGDRQKCPDQEMVVLWGQIKAWLKKISHLTQEKELEGDVSVNLSAFVLNPA